ncbi:protein phosphatase Slingshot homolog 3 [Pyrgilauda ruficollis]|uniref:protein phosphatase Slingshot homolog 3 n=1 Tax=Pyrgilauda ruficollis TaxID=221976 RepID=UPI001B873BEB|nr:protein phosphatase Slingshot homolog 3 [Pyrgilauda ruficollis]
MALVTVRRAGGSAGGPAEEDAPRRGQLQRRQSFVMVKGAARLLPAEEPPPAEPPPAEPPCQAPGQQEQHLHLMMQLLRPQDAIRLAVRLESARPRRVRYLLLVRPEEAGAEAETALLGVDFAHEGATRCTLGMVLPLWSDTQVFLDGDGGFSVTSGGQTRIFKPISVQTMWAVLQELHRACEDAARGGHIPGGPALAWARGYAAALGSEQSCLNEWLAMADLESVRPASPTTPLRPAMPELSEQAVRALLREVMATADLENVTSKEVREELERRTGHSLAEHKDFIDNEMLLVLAQMDRPSRVFPHLFLGSEWNAANLEELQQNRVTHILNVAREIDNFFPALFTYMNVRVYDEEAAELLPHWNDTFLFLSRVRAAGGRALVHCRMGLSRSAATVLAYAMKEFGWPLERALRHVRHCRPGVLPNPGFMRQLDFYQGILSARSVAAGTAACGSPGRPSRRRSPRRTPRGTRVACPRCPPRWRPRSPPRRRQLVGGCWEPPGAPASPCAPSCGASACWRPPSPSRCWGSPWPGRCLRPRRKQRVPPRGHDPRPARAGWCARPAWMVAPPLFVTTPTVIATPRATPMHLARATRVNPRLNLGGKGQRLFTDIATREGAWSSPGGVASEPARPAHAPPARWGWDVPLPQPHEHKHRHRSCTGNKAWKWQPLVAL